MKSLALIVLVILLLPTPILSAFQIQPIQPESPTPNIKKAVGEVFSKEVLSFSITLKKDLPESTVRKVYDEFTSTFTFKRDVSIHGALRSITIREVYVSKLLRDPSGRWIFKVYGKPDNIDKILSKYTKYKEYVEQVIYKPKPETQPMPPDIDIKNIPRNIPGTTNFIIRDIIGVNMVNNTYGLTGKWIRVAVVDTGVDYGHPDLQDALMYWSGSYKGRQVREPLILDADESQVLLLQDVYKFNNTHIYVGGRLYTTLIPWPTEISPPSEYYKIPSWISKLEEPYKFGLTYMFIPGYGITIVGVLLVRLSTTSGYSDALVDANSNFNFADEIWSTSHLTYQGRRIIAPDYNGDKYPDYSLGVLGGFFYDFWWWFSYPAEFHAGWDPQGNYLSIFYDFDSHGTQCSSAIAGRGKVEYSLPGFGSVRLYGFAPEAKIIGVKGLWIGNVETGMLWAAGFDVDPATGRFYYTGQKRASIISNSWGISQFTYDIAGFGYDFESMFVNGIATPGFLDPNYPGILIVQAGGNGGPGYGTITSPGSALAVLTVGASTCMHALYSLSQIDPYSIMSSGGWVAHEVMSWSLRGPTVAGYNKPDVVNVGAWGFTSAPVAIGYDLFGGTSYAAPLTAGVAALIYQVLGETADPALIKSIIMSTSTPLSYDSASMGTGRVHAFRAVSLARLLKGQTASRNELLAYSTSPYNSFAYKTSNIWSWQWCDEIAAYMLWWAGSELKLQSYNIPATWTNRFDTSIYVPDIPQGGSKTFTLTVRNPTNKTVSISPYAVKHTCINSTVKEILLSLMPNYSFNYTFLYIIPVNLTKSDLLEAAATTPFSYFDSDNDYIYDFRVRISLFVWTADTNGNGLPDSTEMKLINYGSARSNWNTATCREPGRFLPGNKAILVRVDLVRGPDTPFNKAIPPTPINITINYYNYTSDSWISIKPSSISIPAGGIATFTGTVSAPSSAIPTCYSSSLVVRSNATPSIYVPISYTVYTDINNMFKQLNTGPSVRILDWISIRGANDWEWRYESGDWRVFYVKPSTKDTWAFEYEVTYFNPNTALITYTLGPDGQFAGAYYGQGSSHHTWLGGGIFEWVGTASGSIINAKRVVTFPSVNYRNWLYPHDKPETGVFTLILRTALFDGSTGYSEPINVRIRGLTVQSLLPPSIINGGKSYIRFSLPYIVPEIFSWSTRPITPFLDLDQKYASGSSTISPSYMSGPFPSDTIFTFQFYAENTGASSQKIDFSAMFAVRLPSLKIYVREGWLYNFITDWYVFEDWTRVIKS